MILPAVKQAPCKRQVQYITAALLHRQLLLSSALLEVGVWAVSVAQACSMCALLPHLRGEIYGSHTGHSSELFISARDKRKSWLYCPVTVGLFTQQPGLSERPHQAWITHI